MYPDHPNIPQRWMYTAAGDSTIHSAQLNRKVWIRDYAAIATKVLACGMCSLGTPVVCVDKEFVLYLMLLSLFIPHQLGLP